MKAAILSTVALLGLILWGWKFLAVVFAVALVATIIAIALGADVDD